MTSSDPDPDRPEDPNNQPGIEFTPEMSLHDIIRAITPESANLDRAASPRNLAQALAQHVDAQYLAELITPSANTPLTKPQSRELAEFICGHSYLFRRLTLDDLKLPDKPVSLVVYALFCIAQIDEAIDVTQPDTPWHPSDCN
jgi:hypothetical protein